MIEVRQRTGKIAMYWIRDHVDKVRYRDGWTVQLDRRIGDGKIRVVFNTATFFKSIMTKQWMEFQLGSVYSATAQSDVDFSLVMFNEQPYPLLADIVIYQQMWPRFLRMLRQKGETYSARKVKL